MAPTMTVLRRPGFGQLSRRPVTTAGDFLLVVILSGTSYVTGTSPMVESNVQDIL